MHVQEVFEFIEYIKKNKFEYEEKSIAFLKLIYNDIYNDFVNEIQKMKDNGCGYNYIDLLEDFKDDLVKFIDDDSSSILYYFKEMIIDGDVDFINVFFDKIDSYSKIVNNHLYRTKDFWICTLTFNIYAMLISYHIYKDDFELFKKRIELYSSVIEPMGLNDISVRNNSFFLLNKKEIFDKIIRIKNFEELVFLRDTFNVCFKNICNNNLSFNELMSLNENIEFVEKVLFDIQRLKEKDPEFDEEQGIRIIDSYLENYDEDEPLFYTPILLYGDRFAYFRDKYINVIRHEEYMNEIFLKVQELNNDLFKYLDSVDMDGEDSFIKCMDAVFDSDTLEELLNKINILKETSELFSSEPVLYSNVLDNIKSLSSNKYKKKVNGQKIMRIGDAINLEDRSDCILGRMEDIYEKMFGEEISYEISHSYEEFQTISGFESNVDSILDDFFEDREKQSLEENEEYLDDNTYDDDTLDKDNNEIKKKTFRKLFGKKW